MATREETKPGSGLAELKSVLPAVVETSSSAVAAREKAAVEARFLVAINRPRDINRFRIRLLEACRRPRFAEVAMYAKPVGGKKVTGPSIRFVEEALRHYGNVDVKASVTFDDPERRILCVTGTDLETNTSYLQDVDLNKTVERRQPKAGEEVVRSRQNSTGQTVYIIKADEDAFINKQNAGSSKAIRTVGLRILPSDAVEEAMEVVVHTLQQEDAKDPTAARKRLVDSFYALGVMPKQITDLLGHELEAVTPAELTMLRSIYTALKDGETTWPEVVEAFGAKKPNGSGEATDHASATETLRQKIESKKAGVQAAKGQGAPAAADDNLSLDAELARGDK